jgi:hypothetical protein
VVLGVQNLTKRSGIGSWIDLLRLSNSISGTSISLSRLFSHTARLEAWQINRNETKSTKELYTTNRPNVFRVEVYSQFS